MADECTHVANKVVLQLVLVSYVLVRTPLRVVYVRYTENDIHNYPRAPPSGIMNII